MADTGEDREIKQRANANEVIRESKELLRKTKEALSTQKKKAPGTRSVHRRFKASK